MSKSLDPSSYVQYAWYVNKTHFIAYDMNCFVVNLLGITVYIICICKKYTYTYMYCTTECKQSMIHINTYIPGDEGGDLEDAEKDEEEAE